MYPGHGFAYNLNKATIEKNKQRQNIMQKYLNIFLKKGETNCYLRNNLTATKKTILSLFARNINVFFLFYNHPIPNVEFARK